MSAYELCQQSGLDPDDLSKLREARLLLPDTRDGRRAPQAGRLGKEAGLFASRGVGSQDSPPPVWETVLRSAFEGRLVLRIKRVILYAYNV